MPMIVETLSLEAAAAHQTVWQQLVETCLEPNVFLTPGFALAAGRHLAGPRPPAFLFVWEEAAATRLLRGLCPLAPQQGFARFLAPRLWTHEHGPLGTPLLDASCAEMALVAILANVGAKGAPSLLFPLLPQDGATAALLAKIAAAAGGGIVALDAHQRPALTGSQDAESYLHKALASGRRRKLKHARARLEAQGPVTCDVIRGDGLQAAAERFFALEAKGWKGRQATAFLKEPERAAFAREAMTALAATGACFITELSVAGQPVASAVMLQSDGRAFGWKKTYDEAFAAASPGVLLMLELTRALLADPSIALTDSCATDPTPMIAQIWSERIPIADLLIETDPPDHRRFAALARNESLWRQWRGGLKAAAQRLGLRRHGLSG